MRPTVDIWLEIIHKRLDAGESAVVAISKANLVTNAYMHRFVFAPTLEEGALGKAAADVVNASADAYEQLKKEQAEAAERIPAEYFTPFSQKEKHEKSLPIPTPGYIAGDPNAR